MMEVRYTPDPTSFEGMNTAQIRSNFLIEGLFAPGTIKLVYSHTDRAVVGSVVPLSEPLELAAPPQLAAEYFAQRREVGVINIGGTGEISVDGQVYPMKSKDLLYIGRGSKDIVFSSLDSASPAHYYLVSYPAHSSCPTVRAGHQEAAPVVLGSQREANRRTLRKYVHAEGVQSCQLVMGMTELEEGSIWNTMPAHTHDRRSEIYLYFGLQEGAVVFHFMGKPNQTRHIVTRSGQATLSPSWSIHSGAGTGSYSFIWAMGGENQDFADMDLIKMADLA